MVGQVLLAVGLGRGAGLQEGLEGLLLLRHLLFGTGSHFALLCFIIQTIVAYTQNQD